MSFLPRGVFIALLLTAGLFLLGGCATLPRPDSVDDALLIVSYRVPNADVAEMVRSDVIQFDGPSAFTLELDGETEAGYSLESVQPGTYRAVSREIVWADGSTQRVEFGVQARVAVLSSSVVLFPLAFNVAGTPEELKAHGVTPVSPEDQRLAATGLSDRVRMSEWAGRTVKGFGPYSPFVDYSGSQFDVGVESTPAGATVSVDGQVWGTTPLTVSLELGKHYVTLEREGYQQYSAFIEVAGAGSESFELQPASPAGDANAEGLAVLLQPFHNLGTGDDEYLQGVFQDTLSLTLERTGLQVLTPPSDTVSSTGVDYHTAQEFGAQTVVAGDYLTSQDSILIHAALYDVQTGLVKASTVFEGKGGIGVFDSIDQMTSQFSTSVEKALPEVGQAVVEERVVTPEAMTFVRRVSEQEVIRRRTEHGNPVYLSFQFGTVSDRVEDPATGETSSRNDSGPSLGVILGWEHPLAPPLVLVTQLRPFYTSAGQEAGASYEIPLDVGLRYNFYGYRSDIYFGLQASTHFASQFTATFQSGSVGFGPFWLFGLNAETGIKVYTYKRFSQRPTFLNFGLIIGMGGYRVDYDFTNGQSYPFEVWLSAGWGVRL